jgi:hypothetical protein
MEERCEKKKKIKKGEGGRNGLNQANWQLSRSQPVLGLPQLLCIMKIYFKGWLLKLMCTLCVNGNLLS